MNLGPETLPERFLNRELSWLAFPHRVTAMARDSELPLIERLRYVGIVGMLHDEFFMKRMSRLMRQLQQGSNIPQIDGKTPREQYEACRTVLLEQIEELTALLSRLLPEMAREGIPLQDYHEVAEVGRAGLRDYFEQSVLPILTPLAVDAEHPFPFISDRTLNLAVVLPAAIPGDTRFVRLKVPDNRPRWVPVPQGAGMVPLEQVIAANLDLLFPNVGTPESWLFRVTRDADGVVGREEPQEGEDELIQPGSIVSQVSSELKARRFAPVVRLEVDGNMPEVILEWIQEQLGVHETETYAPEHTMRLSDLRDLDPQFREDLLFPFMEPAVPERLARLDNSPESIFEEIKKGDLLVHHPYESFEHSVLRFIESAAEDPAVLAIKTSIYRTSADSPIIRALIDAARRGKQVAVLVEITARFDEAPNIAWGQRLEEEGVHVTYGVERLKTHIKLALVVREEEGRIKSYSHVGTGNYHVWTARHYEDLGLLTSDEDISGEVAQLFNALTGATTHPEYRTLLVAPVNLRHRFLELIRREAENAAVGRGAGIRAKMNQLQDPEIIQELYKASRAGVPISLNVRGLCCLRPGDPSFSPTVSVFSEVGRFLEHSRIYEFHNDGSPEVFIGSADWMQRNLDRRVESLVRIKDPQIRARLSDILTVYESDNSSVWDCDRYGRYTRRTPASGDQKIEAQKVFLSGQTR